MKIGAIARLVIACIPFFAAATAHAQSGDSLVDFINEYRTNPGTCEGRPVAPVAALTPQTALGRVRIGSGAMLASELERAGYPVAYAKAIAVTGPRDADAAMDAIGGSFCRVLLSTQFSVIGVGRSGDTWQVVLAQPAARSRLAELPATRDAGAMLLRAVNAARSIDRECGDRHFTAAPALTWNGALSDAALAHSQEMAKLHYFSHQGKDGREVADRAVRAGYRWRAIGENIAAGQESPEEAMAGWLASPGHCANIMNRFFTEMGAGYGLSSGRDKPHVYWTQVFGQPK